jgi:hypothetical protein
MNMRPTELQPVALFAILSHYWPTTAETLEGREALSPEI